MPTKANDLAAEQTDAPETKTYTVAKGRNVTHDGKHYEPGDTLDLPVEDGERLRDLGFFLGDDGSVVVPQVEGPAVVQGAEIKEG